MTSQPILSASEQSADRWNNEGRQLPPERPSREGLPHELQRQEIIPVWGGYRYTNASDAIAAAKRANSG